MSENDLVLLNQLLEQRMETIGDGLSESNYFELFAAEQVLKDDDLSYEEIQDGIVGDGGDGGIDGFYFFVNGALCSDDSDYSPLKKNIDLRVVVIQAKTSSGFDEAVVEKFIGSARDLFNFSVKPAALRKVYNKDLLKKVIQFREIYLGFTSNFPKLKVQYFCVAKATDVEHPNVRRKVTELEKTLKDLLSSAEFSFDFFGASHLLASARKMPTNTYKLSLAESSIATDRGGLICLVRLKDFYDFIKGEDGRIREHLFESNVRDYQGNTEVNKEIRTTLEASTVEDFWWLNNGISVLCSKSSATGKILDIEDPEIVNGLQTSREIFEVFSKSTPRTDERTVLVRVLMPSSETSRDRIIKATNSQTSIPSASLRATDKIHRDIEEFLSPKGLYYDRRKNQYKNLGKPVKKIVGILYMAQSVMACALQEPANARARPSTQMKKDDSYGRIFDPSYSLPLFWNCVTIVRSCEDFLKTSRNEHSNNLRFYVAMLATLRLCGIPHPRAHEIAALDLRNLTTPFIEGVARDVHKEYMKLGGTDQVAKGVDLQDKLLRRHVKDTQKLLRSKSKQA